MRGLQLLLGLGASILALGQLFRFSLGQPGHQGLEARALLATARLNCPFDSKR